ncbi:hypothetical protein WR25_21943 [Diploscapter pachys]|uniref:Uncharacterized protein n=1 Tax=Diploscapter pachys TaxID=2018661 RepID=A0A2A2K5J5_9BILA|nr:hypothetical protein WR25_21943 [Diploscapter pachys]
MRMFIDEFQLTVVLCQNDSQPIDFKSGSNPANYGTVRRLMRSTHGNLFLVNQTELVALMANVLSTFKNPEDISAYYGLQPGASISFKLLPDSSDKQIYLLYWIYPESDAIGSPTINIGNNALISPLDSNRYYSLYSINSLDMGSITVTVTGMKNVNFIVRCYISTPQTVLMDFNDDPMIDFGNGIVFTGIEYTTTARPLNIDNAMNVSYIPYTSDGIPLNYEIFSTLKDPEICTAPYMMSIWHYPCPPGALSTEVKVWLTNGNFIKRNLPTYCSSSIVQPHEIPHTCSYPNVDVFNDVNDEKNAFMGLISQNDNELIDTTCPQMNLQVFGDWRQYDFRQVVFLVEKSTSVREADVDLYTLLNDSLPNWERAFSPKQYGLMVFDDQEIQTLVNNFDIQDFLKKTNQAMKTLNYKDSKSNRVLDAIYVATKLKLIGPMMINIIMHQNSQVITLTKYDYTLVDKDIQSGGRYTPLKMVNSALTPKFIDTMSYEKQLVVDERDQDCMYGTNFTFNVENYASNVIVHTVGLGIGVQVFDAKKNPIALDQSNTINAEDTKVWNIGSFKS